MLHIINVIYIIMNLIIILKFNLNIIFYNTLYIKVKNTQLNMMIT